MPQIDANPDSSPLKTVLMNQADLNRFELNANPYHTADAGTFQQSLTLDTKFDTRENADFAVRIHDASQNIGLHAKTDPSLFELAEQSDCRSKTKTIKS